MREDVGSKAKRRGFSGRELGGTTPSRDRVNQRKLERHDALATRTESRYNGSASMKRQAREPK
jgi:hypothetical protein